MDAAETGIVIHNDRNILQYGKNVVFFLIHEFPQRPELSAIRKQRKCLGMENPK